jgi:hypothetical protein
MLPVLGLVTGSLHRKGVTQMGTFRLPDIIVHSALQLRTVLFLWLGLLSNIAIMLHPCYDIHELTCRKIYLWLDGLLIDWLDCKLHFVFIIIRICVNLHLSLSQAIHISSFTWPYSIM